MGLTMGEKKALTRETAARYRAAERQAKHTILDEFTQITGYHRKYAIHLLRNWGTEHVQLINGEAVKLIVGQPRKNKPNRRPERRIYDEPVIQALRRVWELFDYMCGKRLAVLMRLNMALLQTDPETCFSSFRPGSADNSDAVEVALSSYAVFRFDGRVPV